MLVTLSQKTTRLFRDNLLPHVTSRDFTSLIQKYYSTKSWFYSKQSGDCHVHALCVQAAKRQMIIKHSNMRQGWETVVIISCICKQHPPNRPLLTSREKATVGTLGMSLKSQTKSRWDAGVNTLCFRVQLRTVL